MLKMVGSMATCSALYESSLLQTSPHKNQCLSSPGVWSLLGGPTCYEWIWMAGKWIKTQILTKIKAYQNKRSDLQPSFFLTGSMATVASRLRWQSRPVVLNLSRACSTPNQWWEVSGCEVALHFRKKLIIDGTPNDVEHWYWRYKYRFLKIFK